MKTIVAVLLGAVALAFAACANNDATYDIVIKNMGNQHLEDISLTYPRFAFEFGVLSPGTEKSYGLAEAPFPVKATLKWRVQDTKKVMEKEVAVPHPLPAIHAKGTYELQFTIAGEDASARVAVIYPGAPTK